MEETPAVTTIRDSAVAVSDGHDEVESDEVQPGDGGAGASDVDEFRGKDPREMDDATLARLVDSLMRDVDMSGNFHAHETSADYAERDNDIQRQYLMQSLRRGYFSTEPVAVGVGGKIDIDYGNPGPEADALQQMTNDGFLGLSNQKELQNEKVQKQQRFRTLSIFAGVVKSGPISEEYAMLKEDDDVHSVSVISMLHDEDSSQYEKCADDCWLRRPEAVPDLPTQPVLEHAGEKELNDAGQGIYDPIPIGYTRLLHLEPGTYGDEVVCRLTVMPVALDRLEESSSSSPTAEYEALSYTWGDDTAKFLIQCNGKPLGVAHNLFFALQNLRDPTQERHIWIDAICINQQDLQERSEQVRHMLEIYKNAASVVIWLGEESHDSHLAVESMKHLDDVEDREKVMFRNHEEACHARLAALYDAQCALLSRPWFRRSWIRQEISAARDVTVTCGRDAVGWYTLKRSAARVRRLHKALSAALGKDVPEFDEAQTSVISCLARGWMYGETVLKYVGCIRSVWYYNAGGLMDLLMAGREFEATNPRDKVYAVLGLARVPMVTSSTSPGEARGPAAFPVDYSKTVSEVYQDVVKYLINESRSLDILSLLLTTRNAASDDDLPSWVPDWRVPVTEIPAAAHFDFISLKYAAGGLGTKAAEQSHDELGILHVYGHMVETIARMDPVTAHAQDMLNTWSGFSKYDPEAKEGEENEGRPLYVDQFDPKQHRTKVAYTRQGAICLVPSSTQEGDMITLLLGGKLAFVLRLLETKEENGDDGDDGEHGEASAESSHVRDQAPPEGHETGSEVEPAVSAVDKVEECPPAIKARLVGPCIIPELMFGAGIARAAQSGLQPYAFALV